MTTLLAEPDSPVDVYDQHAALSMVAAGASSQMRTVWAAGPTAPDDLVAYLSEVLPDLAVEHRSASASLAADWYDDLREIASPPTAFVAEPLADVEPARVRASVRWATDPLFRPERHVADPIDLMAGSWERLIADAHRETIAEAAVADKATEGWARYGSADSCSFCRALIGRGAIYSARTARFASHDNCGCLAGPVFTDAGRVDKYVPTARRLSESGRAERNRRIREWIAN